MFRACILLKKKTKIERRVKYPGRDDMCCDIEKKIFSPLQEIVEVMYSLCTVGHFFSFNFKNVARKLTKFCQVCRSLLK